MNYDLASAEYLIVLMSGHIDCRSPGLHSSPLSHFISPQQQGAEQGKQREACFIFTSERSKVHKICKHRRRERQALGKPNLSKGTTTIRILNSFCDEGKDSRGVQLTLGPL